MIKRQNMNCKRATSEGGRPSSRIADNLPTTIPEWFGIFHQWDFIYADATESKAEWKTNTKGFPLSPTTLYKRWLSLTELIGVRFETSRNGRTWYVMIDIDFGSQYHPFQNPTAIPKLVAILEEKAGLCRHLKIQSSSSGGLHLYFPFPEAQPCLKTAFTIHNLVTEAGFRVTSGQLEIFPNIKLPDSLYNGHRLPLQQDSYALNDDFQPIHNSLEQFINSWVLAASHQDRELLATTIDQAKPARSKIPQLHASSRNVAEWKERLEETLERGWTQVGQTNQIIKEVCQYAIVFQNQGKTWGELDWSATQKWVYQTIVNLPGYKTFCNHQNNIRKRISEWLKANQKNRKHTPLGSQIKQFITSPFSTNKARQEEALQRI
ncbi:hypothetical protein [Leptolyngbya sp. ST-U4]|uniref:hypothetical protein n=1 Tax=Leptolyngbya sp. ST-U4 TaxID=2933912 RepID=UPI00329729E7